MTHTHHAWLFCQFKSNDSTTTASFKHITPLVKR
jgi:hypothetical protein